MRARLAWLLLPIASIALQGCSVFNVHQGSDSTKGIIFYSKVGKLKQTTTFSRSWIEVQFTLSDLDASGKKSNTQSALLPITERAAEPAALNKGLAQAQAAAGTARSVNDVVNAFTGSGIPPLTNAAIIAESDTSFVGPPANLLQSLLSNTTELVVEVDYTKPYTYNARIPVFGSADSSIELAGDGSLSKAETKADTGKLADALPISALLTKAFGLAAAAAPAAIAPVQTPNRELTITVTRRGFLYTLTKLLEPTVGRNQLPLEFGKQDSIVRTELGANVDQKKDPGKQATFEGSVNLPKQ